MLTRNLQNKMNNRNYIFIFSILTLFLLFFPLNSGAQTSINVSPKHPGPNESVKLSLSSFGSNLNQSTITWYVNGSIALSGIGEKDLNITTRGVGTETIVVAEIEGNDFYPEEVEISIIPAEVSLFWEANTYTPPFYKGKAEYSYNSDARIVAIPNFPGNPDPKSLNYTWEKDGRILGSLSGYGKNTLFLEGTSIIRPVSVSVTAENNSGASAKDTTVLESKSPEIIFYRKSPSLGILFNKALDSFSLGNEKEGGVWAEPFLFANGPSQLVFDWKVDGEKINQYNQFINFGQQEEGNISSKLELTITNPFSTIQQARKILNISS